MKKVFVTGTRGIPNFIGGIESHCEWLFPRLVAMGIDVTLARRTPYVNDDYKEWNGVKLVDIICPQSKKLEAIVHTFLAITKARLMGADILHIHAVGPALLAPYARLLGMKVVLTHHGPDYDRDKWGRVAKFMLRLGERIGCKFSNDIIVISNVIKDLIAEKYNRTENVHLIYNGVPEAEKTDHPHYFQKLGIEEGKYILGMCRFVPEKNLHHLVEAFAQLKDKGDCKLVLAGDANITDKYSKYLKDLAFKNGVVLTGFVKGRKLQSLLTHCRAYCLPSSHEGLPIALLEAMSYGVKVVVSDIPANLEVGLPNEDYFRCGDIKDLSDKLQTIVSAPLEHKEYDMGKYAWDIIAQQVKEIYSKY